MEVQEKINELSLENERLRIQIERLEAHIESESGTLERESTRLRREIEIVEDKFQKAMYNGEGLVIQVDRLKQEASARKSNKHHITGLYIMVVGGILIELFRLLTTK